MQQQKTHKISFLSKMNKNRKSLLVSYLFSFILHCDVFSPFKPIRSREHSKTWAFFDVTRKTTRGISPFIINGACFIVFQLHTRETWLKQARTVKQGEEPYKLVKGRPKRVSKCWQFSATIELFRDSSCLTFSVSRF